MHNFCVTVMMVGYAILLSWHAGISPLRLLGDVCHATRVVTIGYNLNLSGLYSLVIGCRFARSNT
jgi:hypothetical protein